MNPHNLYLMMFSPSSAHIAPFCPNNGADAARQYACKYAGKPEKWYYLEGDRSGVKEFLKCRTVGLCMTHNRLLNFHVVRSTKPVTFTPADFVAPRGIRIPREQSHMNKHPAYPDTLFYLSHSGKYFFRHPDLRHLRIEQVSAAALSVIIDWGLLSCSFRAVAKTEVQSGDPRTARSYSPLISPVSPRL